MVIPNGILASPSAREKYHHLLLKAPLGVFDAATATYRMIPASFQPLIVDDKLWRQVAVDCRAILSALKKVSVWLRQEQNGALAKRLFASFGKLEREGAWGQLECHEELATVRFDFFFEEDDLRVLEINATIPAMQAYSDMVRAAYQAALVVDGVVVDLAKRSNGKDLLQSLCRGYEAVGGAKARPRIAIVARHGDAQIAELKWLQAQWRTLGHDVILGAPENVTLKSGQVHVDGVPADLVYRHVFAHRLDSSGAFAEACRKSKSYRVFNSVSAHLEVKGMLAELSRVADDERASQEAGLTPEEILAVQKRVPWSRVIDQGASTGPSGNFLADLTAFLKSADRHALVIKSSAGYGGHGVFMGLDFDSAASQARVQKIFNIDQPIVWDRFVDLCAQAKGDPWVVQRLVPGKRWQHDALVGGVVHKDRRDFIDCSLFGGMFDEGTVPGGAVRFSAGQVVNIGRGGGVAPLLLRSEAP